MRSSTITTLRTTLRPLSASTSLCNPEASSWHRDRYSAPGRTIPSGSRPARLIRTCETTSPGSANALVALQSMDAAAARDAARSLRSIQPAGATSRQNRRRSESGTTVRPNRRARCQARSFGSAIGVGPDRRTSHPPRSRTGPIGSEGFGLAAIPCGVNRNSSVSRGRARASSSTSASMAR